MSNAQWKKYTGSDEQIAEIFTANDVLFRVKDRPDRLMSSIFTSDINTYLTIVTHYLICDPHPNADMICQWARTGQPVYIKIPTVAERVDTGARTNMYFRHECTTTPDWNIPGAEYSFTEFKEEV